MTKKITITLAEALDLVDFRQYMDGKWYIYRAKGDVCHAKGNVSFVEGGVGNVEGDVGKVKGTVHSTINGKEWEHVESQEEKLKRLIKESGNKELIETLNQIENNS